MSNPKSLNVRSSFWDLWVSIRLGFREISWMINICESEDELMLARSCIKDMIDFCYEDADYLYQKIEGKKYEINWEPLPF